MSETSEERFKEIAELLEGKIEDNEELVISCFQKQIEVIPRSQALNSAKPSTLKKTHEELYGHLLHLNEQLRDIGTLSLWIIGILAIGCCVAIHKSWMNPIFGLPVAKLQGFWVYFLICLIFFSVHLFLFEFQIKKHYQFSRGALIEEISMTGISFYRILAMIKGDPAVDEISKQLKLDTSFAQEY